MAGNVYGQSFYDISAIQKIEIYFSQPNWDYQLDTSRYGIDGYVIADWIRINGLQLDSVGVKYKGNSSYDSTYLKNPLHIALDEVKSQSYQGITDVKLGNGYADPSVIREVLAYSILENYMDCPRSNFAQLYINGNYIGVFSNDESINKDFCSSHFNSSKNTFFKCNPVVNPGPTTKSNLRYIPFADSSGYFNFYELKSDYGWNELVSLCDTVTNYPAAIANNLDMDRFIWMLAYNAVLVNLDSYSGVFCQNYYLYKDKTDRFDPIVWDLNMAFGGFPYAGSGISSMGSLTIANMQQFPPDFHASDPYWPVINVVMNDPSWRKMYFAHARTINNENFANNSYLATASQLQTTIDTAVQADINSFFTYAQFQNGMNTDYVVGSYSVPGISNLMSSRVAYLQTNTDFAYIPPVISSVSASDTTPMYNSNVDILAVVTNATAVYLKYKNSKSDRYTTLPLFDDGLHNDGAAGDQTFGNSFTVLSPQVYYYVYAENANAGMFSPQRAEHEFYRLQTVFQLPAPGQIVINEFLAGNVTDTVNEYGNHADWIELYNNSAVPVDLYGLYLTDDATNLNKFDFPQNTIIQPHDYLIIWADEESDSPNYMHCNFKLSVNGEGIWLSDGQSIVIDSAVFGPQVTDISLGRCPNGTGNFISLSPTTYNISNCPLSVQEISEKNNIHIYPNPGSDIVFVQSEMVGRVAVTIENTIGAVVHKLSYTLISQNQLIIIDIKELKAGYYFLRLESDRHSSIKPLVKQ